MFRRENIKLQNDETNFQCPCCEKHFNNVSELSIHGKIHNVEIATVPMKIYYNDELEIGIGSDQNVSVSENMFQCQYCLKKFDLETSLLTHLETYKDEEPFQCQFCGSKFDNKSDLSTHRRIHSMQNIAAIIENRNATIGLEPEKNPKSLLGQFECEFCEKIFGRELDLSRHVQMIHFGKNLLKCNLCESFFADKPKLILHKKRIHLGKRLDKKFKCLLCDKYFLRQVFLKNHLKSHSSNAKIVIRKNRMGGKPVKFDFGDKPVIRKCTGIRKTSAKVLIGKSTNSQAANPRTRYGCEFCLETFSRLSDATRHERAIHFGDKQFKCNFCEKAYTDKHQLTLHENKYHGENNKLNCQSEAVSPRTRYGCQYCEKSFCRKSDVTRHERSIHFGVKQFKCSFCEKAYTDKTNLIRHENRYHSDNSKLKCQFCYKSFEFQDQLTEHENSIHLGEKPFNCPLCDKNFLRKIFLQNHLKSHDVDSKEAKISIAEPHCAEKIIKVESEVTPVASKSTELQEVTEGMVLRKALLQKTDSCEKPVELEFDPPVIRKCVSAHETSAKELIRKSTESQKVISESNNLQAVISRTRYECRFCERSFFRRADTARHEQITHFGKKPFKCSFCENQYTTKTHLNLHENKCRSGNIKFKCFLCDETFADKGQVTEHEKLCH